MKVGDIIQFIHKKKHYHNTHGPCNGMYGIVIKKSDTIFGHKRFTIYWPKTNGSSSGWPANHDEIKVISEAG